MPRRPDNVNLAQSFETLRNDYSAAKSNRFRRQRTGLLPLGSGADYHYRNETDYFKVVEYARDMDRNDAVVGQTIDRAVTNIIQDGFGFDPQTGDAQLDTDLRQRFESETNDPQQFDLAGEYTFWELEQLALRHCFVDGDVLGLATSGGQLEMVEGHRLRTPTGTTRNVVHGVLVNPVTRRREEYWCTPDDTPLRNAVTKVADIRRYPTYDEGGVRQVFHALVSKRISQTRGVTALAPIFDICGMVEDINFATLVQRQLVACFAIFRERDLNFEVGGPAPGGIRSEESLGGGVSRILQGVGPGMEIGGLPGEKLKMDSPHIPNPEFFPHMKLMLTLIGINLGMPLVMVLMDGSETNFSGWRGAIDQARMGFHGIQKRFSRRWHRPIVTWKINRWLATDAALRSALERGVNVFAHRWKYPTWPYIQPLQDASADLLRLRNGLISPRRRAAERGMDLDVLRAEIVEDNAAMIEAAAQKAAELNAKYPGLGITWREVASLPTPDGVTIAVGDGTQQDGPAQQNQPPKQ